MSSTKSSKTKRGKQANQMKPAPYPLTIDHLLSGEMTFVNAQKYFKSLKDSWTVETCAAGKGFRMASKDVKRLTRQRNALIHGLRIIFTKHNLLSIDYVQSEGSGMFHPVYVQGGGSLRFYMKDDQSSIPSKTTIPSNVDYVKRAKRLYDSYWCCPKNGSALTFLPKILHGSSVVRPKRLERGD